MSIASDLARGRLRLDEERAAGAALRQAKQSLAGESQPHRVHASEETIRTDLLSYHCTFCHAFCLVVDRTLALLPHRSTDGAAILVTADRHFRLRLDKGEVKAVRRARGVEKQWRWKCRQCALPVVYQCEDWQEAGGVQPPPAQLLYIVEGAVVGWDELQAETTAADAGEGAAQDGDERGGRRGVVGRSEEEEELLREIEALRQQQSTTSGAAPPSTAEGVP